MEIDRIQWECGTTEKHSIDADWVPKRAYKGAEI